MGLGKWFLKNGPGSPGSTAKTFAKLYNSIPKREHDSEWEEVFTVLYKNRIQAYEKIGNIGDNIFSAIKMENVVDFSDGDLPLFVFEMMFLETSKFRDNIVGNEDVFILATEVIREVIIENAPSSTNIDLVEFRKRALYFVSYF